MEFFLKMPTSKSWPHFESTKGCLHYDLKVSITKYAFHLIRWMNLVLPSNASPSSEIYDYFTN